MVTLLMEEDLKEDSGVMLQQHAASLFTTSADQHSADAADRRCDVKTCQLNFCLPQSSIIDHHLE